MDQYWLAYGKNLLLVNEDLKSVKIDQWKNLVYFLSPIFFFSVSFECNAIICMSFIFLHCYYCHGTIYMYIASHLNTYLFIHTYKHIHVSIFKWIAVIAMSLTSLYDSKYSCCPWKTIYFFLWQDWNLVQLTVRGVPSCFCPCPNASFTVKIWPLGNHGSLNGMGVSVCFSFCVFVHCWCLCSCISWFPGNLRHLRRCLFKGSSQDTNVRIQHWEVSLEYEAKFIMHRLACG